ncbi:MAG: hypothetical protein IJC40_04490 [Muribaculaceae bacterium]|nr:hypothetical protein [Muribaculaceae bacterium]
MRGLLLLVTLLMVLVSCSENQSQDTAASLAYAEASIAAQNYEAAQNTCDSLMQVTTDLYATQWCHLSIIYMKLADVNISREEENTAVATRCYNKAFDINKDSAEIYYSALSPEEYAHYDMLTKLVNPIRDVTVEEPLDVDETHLIQE